MSVNRRDDFPPAVIDNLARRVGMRCSNPQCRRLTSGPRMEEDKSVNVGVAAHITAASVGGPRFDPTLTSTQRRAASNGIWLCQIHAKLVDNDEARYSVELLRAWKQETEAEAHSAVGGFIEGLSAHNSPRPSADAKLPYYRRIFQRIYRRFVRRRRRGYHSRKQRHPFSNPEHNLGSCLLVARSAQSSHWQLRKGYG